MKKNEDNCFDVLRLIAACIVLLSHSFRWFEIKKPIWLTFFTDGSTGVIILFAISGYLIMGSYDRCIIRNNIKSTYFINRILRIYPALIASYFVVSVINFMIHVEVFQLSYIKYLIKSIVMPNGYGFGNGISNGALWTISVELSFYFLVPIMYKFLKKLNMISWVILILVLWQFNVWDSHIIDLASNYKWTSWLKITNVVFYLYEFLIGSFLYTFRDKIIPIISKRRNVIIGLTAWTIWSTIYIFTNVIPHTGEMHNAIFGIVIPFLTIATAFSFGNIRLKFDLSYGIYLYHMLIINPFLYLGQKNIYIMFLTWVLTFTCAFLSFKFIEKPALNLKDIINNYIQQKRTSFSKDTIND